MVESKITDILNKRGIAVGKRLSVAGEFRRGVPSGEIGNVEQDFKKINSFYLDEIVLIDLTKLTELDSIGIRNTLPIVIKCNSELKSKNRTLISLLGNKKSDVFNAVKDKFPSEIDRLLPWYEKEEEFFEIADID